MSGFRVFVGSSGISYLSCLRIWREGIGSEGECAYCSWGAFGVIAFAAKDFHRNDVRRLRFFIASRGEDERACRINVAVACSRLDGHVLDRAAADGAWFEDFPG